MTTDAATIDRAGLAERERVLALLRAKEAGLRALGVTRLRLFGSIARGGAGPESDVDLLADIDHSSHFSLLDLVGLQHSLEDVIGRKVQIATAAEKMRPRIRRRVEADAIEVFLSGHPLTSRGHAGRDQGNARFCLRKVPSTIINAITCSDWQSSAASRSSRKRPAISPRR